MPDVPRGLRVFPGSGRRFSYLFSAIMYKLGLEDYYTPGCVRPGGATAEYMRSRDATKVRFLGRWKTDVILNTYLQEAVASYMAVDLPTEAIEFCVDIVEEFSGKYAHPPREHWSYYFSRGGQVKQHVRGLRLKERARELMRKEVALIEEELGGGVMSDEERE